MFAPLPGHGVLIQLEKTGIYIIGKSGVGKTETALQLIDQGATLICDDAPILAQDSDSHQLQGSCPEGFYGLMHLRDLGIINIIELLGKQSFESSHSIDFIIELIQTNNAQVSTTQRQLKPSEPELIKSDYQQWQYQSWTIPGIQLHLYPNRNIPLLIKTAVMQFNKIRDKQ